MSPDKDDADPADEAGDAAGGSDLSRTERTRAATAVNQLGIELTRLSPGDLDRLALPERVRDAVDVCQGLKARSRGRQNRLIGQLLRAEDHESIRARFDSLRQQHRVVIQQEKQSEKWLARLIEEGDSAVEALIEAHPGADRQRLRQLVRQARKTPQEKKGQRARRELLRAIRTLRRESSVALRP